MAKYLKNSYEGEGHTNTKYGDYGFFCIDGTCISTYKKGLRRNGPLPRL